MELIMTMNISSTSLPSCVWLSRKEQLLRSRAFVAFVAVRKEMSPLFEFPDDKTTTKKEGRKKKLDHLIEALKAKKDIAVAKAQKAYELFRCFVVGEVQTQWDRIVN
jgi:hypothetical protein